MNSLDLSIVPNKPGCYLWKDKNSEVIYVGKAKNLRSRMGQYFKDNNSPKTNLLVKHIRGFEYQTTPSEIDALLFEINLINKYEPKYNIRLKYSKTYPYIEITKGNNVNLRLTNKIKNNNSLYFGPFPEGYSAWKIIKLLKSTFPFNKCQSPNSGKPCVLKQIGLCMGQCCEEITYDDYLPYIKKIKDFLSGNSKEVKTIIMEQISNYSEKQQFEEANKIKNYLTLIEKLSEKQQSYFSDFEHRDIIAATKIDNILSISMTFVRFGKLNLTENFLFNSFSPDINSELSQFLVKFYSSNFKPSELILENELYGLKEVLNCLITIPIKGKKRELLNLTIQDSQDRLKNNSKVFIEKLKREEEAKQELQKLIKVDNLKEIEMVDISSLQGEEQVGVVINYTNSNFNKNKYRKYIIKSTKTMDDYFSIEETVYRHFYNKLMNNEKMPNLFIVDGKHQVHNALSVLKKLNINIDVIGLKKDKNHNSTSIFLSNNKEIDITNNRNLYIFLASIQEEVHRFAINFHKNRRHKKILKTSLHIYDFLNEADINNLFLEFKTIRKIKIANFSELSKIIGNSKAKKLFNILNK